MVALISGCAWSSLRLIQLLAKALQEAGGDHPCAWTPTAELRVQGWVQGFTLNNSNDKGVS